MQQQANLTDLERAQRDLYGTRMAMIQQSRLALQLLEEKTVQQAQALEASIAARLQAEAAAAAKPDGAEVVELRREGPVAAVEERAVGEPAVA